MLANFSQINYIAVALATVISFFLGGIWFAVLFAKPYNAALGRESLPSAKPSALFLVGPLVCNVISILTSAILIKAFGIQNATDAVIFGVVVGLGYVGSTCMNIAINPNFPHPFKYAVINIPYFLISNVITSSVLVLMP